MTIFAGDKERNLANTVMDWLLNLGYLGLFLGTFLAGTVLPLSSAWQKPPMKLRD